jgi:hypothetical protein
MHGGAVVGKTAKDDASHGWRLGQRIHRRRDRDPRRTIRGKAIDAGGNRGKGNRGKAVLLAQFDGTGVTRRQRLIDGGTSPIPDRADGMNDVSRRQTIALGNFGAAGFTPVQHAAFGEELGTRGAVDRTVDAAPTEQGRIRGVDDGVNA